jgi:hypothetical protein
MPRSAGYRHNEDTRKKIKAAQIINRLEKHVFSDKPILDASQVNAAKALLNKVLPDLQAVDMTAQVEGSFSVTVVSGVPRADD